MKHLDKSSFYQRLFQQVEALIGEERDAVANMANISALLFMEIESLNWAGFYLHRDQQLVLGPFQGKPACIRIPIGKGVCGTAASSRQPQLVDDVHQFPGHIACDGASNSELVIPMILGGELLGVLDLDSPLAARFDGEDLNGLLPIVEYLSANSDFN